MDKRVESVIAYHERTKHDLPNRYAPALGYMDWETQPNPFRLYESTDRLPLDHPELTDLPRLDTLYSVDSVESNPLDRVSVSQWFYDSLAISAWKAAGSNRSSLRCNPSSGNLHPTEAYLIGGPIPGLCDEGGVFHYSPLLHALERRASLSQEHLQSLALGENEFLCALTSIFWRESWKYGERAFRYCQLDVGHALASLGYAAAALGWQVNLLDQASDDTVAWWCGSSEQTGPEAEHPDCLLLVSTADVAKEQIRQRKIVAPDKDLAFEGTANRLSAAHHPWKAIDEVADACRKSERRDLGSLSTSSAVAPLEIREISARRIIHQRRSAAEMDGSSRLSKADFYRILQRLMPVAEQAPFGVLGGLSYIHPLLFVHRVDEVTPGLYLLMRESEEQELLNSALRDDFAWRAISDCPAPLFLLEEGDVRRVAELISCHQQIASQGVFAVAMLARFEPILSTLGAAAYRRLYWEAGLLGQVLYLEAEACGLRGTGIGCFFDDAVHELVGLRDRQYQSLYHFTLGGAVEDSRLQTLPAYHHLK